MIGSRFVGFFVLSLVASHTVWSTTTAAQTTTKTLVQIAQSNQDKNIEFWNSSTLRMEQAVHLLQPNCGKAPENFIACLQGLDQLAANMKPKAIFLTDAQATSQPELINKLIKKYGVVSLYEARKPETSPSVSQSWEKVKKSRAIEAEAAANLFKQSAQNNIDVGAIVNDLSPLILQGDLYAAQPYVASQVINAYLAAALDPHTHLDSDAANQNQYSGADESFVGIGVQLQFVAEKFIISLVFENGPAYKAGVFARDEIVQLDGQSVTGKTSDDLVKGLRGPAGSTLKIQVLRKGKKIDLTIVRGTIRIQNLEAKMINDFGISVGYIRLRSFMDKSGCDKLATAEQQLQSQGAQALVLDLRDNGGGLVDQAVCIGGLFVGRKTILKAKSLDLSKEQVYNSSTDQITNLPMVTLVNGYSASASEVLSGALQDYKRSWVIGERSFGKASVQRSTSFADPVTSESISGVTLWKTVQRFFQPSGRTNQVVGIVPDFEVFSNPNPTDDDKFAMREADYYSNALGAIGAAWKNPRADEAQKLASCATGSGQMQAKFEQTRDQAIPSDYQILAAESYFKCGAK